MHMTVQSVQHNAAQGKCYTFFANLTSLELFDTHQSTNQNINPNRGASDSKLIFDTKKSYIEKR